MSDKPVDDDDRALFRRSVGQIKRLTDDKVRHAPRKPSPRRRRHTTDDTAYPVDMLSDHVHEEELVDANGELSFARSGVAQRTLRKLRRGHMPMDAELDLHGMTVRQAQAALATFLAESHGFGLRSVRIVHGKGFGSRGGTPVIKTLLNRWLRLRTEVLAFTTAQPAHGGTGAMYVLLKR